MIIRSFLPSAALVAALTLVAPAAFAFDQQETLDRLKAQMTAQGFDIAWGGVSEADGGLVLDGVTLGMVGQGEKVPVGQITLTDITDEDDDIVRIGTMSLPSFEAAGPDGNHVAVTEVTVEGLVLPGPETTDEIAKLGLYDSLSIGKVEADTNGAKVFTMQDLAVTMDRKDDGSFAFNGGVDTFGIDMTQLPDEQSRATMAAFGYQTLSGGVTIDGTWDPTSGKMVLSDYSFTVDDAGTLGMTIDLSGYTLDLIKQMREISKKMATATDEEKQAQGLAMLGLLQGMTFSAASIRFDDDGLTQKALDYTGKRQGMTAADAANQAKAVVPFMLAQLQNPEFVTQVSAAVNAYLDNPQSIEIAARPATPQPFAALMAAGMADPKSLITALGVSVTANQ